MLGLETRSENFKHSLRKSKPKKTFKIQRCQPLDGKMHD